VLGYFTDTQEYSGLVIGGHLFLFVFLGTFEGPGFEGFGLGFFLFLGFVEASGMAVETEGR